MLEAKGDILFRFLMKQALNSKDYIFLEKKYISN